MSGEPGERRERGEAGAGGGGPEEPGRKESERLWEARDAVLDGLAEALAGLHRLRQATGEPSGSGPAADVPHVDVAPGADGGEILLSFMRLQLDLLNRVLAFSREQTEQLVARMRRPRAPHAGGWPRALRLTGPPGGVAEGVFVVENGSSGEVEVELRVSAVSGDDCGSEIEGTARISPERARLRPGSEVEVEVRIELDAARFQPRRRYRANAEVISPGRPQRRVPVTIEVREPMAPGGA